MQAGQYISHRGAASDYRSRHLGVGTRYRLSAGAGAVFSATGGFCSNRPDRLRNSLLDGLRDVPFRAFLASFMGGRP